MKVIAYDSIQTSQEYNQLLKNLYIDVKQEVEEIKIPSVKIIAVKGNEPPASPQYQTALACLYGVGYTLKMGLKFNKLPRPNGYFDYKVGALGSLWWSIEGPNLEINNPTTLRWKAYLLVPSFVDEQLIQSAIAQAKMKNPAIPYDQVKLEQFDEGHAIQILNLGPYDKEQPTINTLNQYMTAHGLQMNGHHHEIYISDPRRTAPERIKTIIRYPVK